MRLAPCRSSRVPVEEEEKGFTPWVWAGHAVALLVHGLYRRLRTGLLSAAPSGLRRSGFSSIGTQESRPGHESRGFTAEISLPPPFGLSTLGNGAKNRGCRALPVVGRTWFVLETVQE